MGDGWMGQEHDRGRWLARDAVTAGWVCLDGGDNDPKRSWRYLLLAADPGGQDSIRKWATITSGM